jgi:hypothetical protein
MSLYLSQTFCLSGEIPIPQHAFCVCHVRGIEVPYFIFYLFCGSGTPNRILRILVACFSNLSFGAKYLLHAGSITSDALSQFHFSVALFLFLFFRANAFFTRDQLPVFMK